MRVAASCRHELPGQPQCVRFAALFRIDDPAGQLLEPCLAVERREAVEIELVKVTGLGRV